MKRYEALLRLSKCLTAARPEDLVTSIAAELRPVVDYDLLDIVVNQQTSREANPVPVGADRPVCESESRRSSEDTYEDAAPPRSSAIRCLPIGEEIKSQCSLPLISRGSERGF